MVEPSVPPSRRAKRNSFDLRSSACCLVSRQFFYAVAALMAVLPIYWAHRAADGLTGRDSGSTSPTQQRLGKPSKSDSRPPPSAPGGFVVRGTCNLERIRERKERADLGVFVKHGVHVVQHVVPERCEALKGHELGLRPMSGGLVPQWNVEAFVNSTSEHKLLAVRGQASFYKSVFNHICNKRIKKRWRKQNGVNCEEEESFMKMLRLNQQEIAIDKNPFLLKELVLASKELKRVMLVDYTCIPNVVSSLCGETLVNFEELPGELANSAEGQNYTDYWSIHNYAPFAPFNPFWDSIYEDLKENCCLELVKEQ